MNAFWYATADLFGFTFKIMEFLGMYFNIFLILVGSGFMIYWIWLMYKNPDLPEQKVRAER
jgi:hypothetical protein